MEDKGALIPFDLMDELIDYFQQRADADGGPDGYRANREMHLHMRLEREARSLRPEGSKPSGYVAIMEDKNAPKGCWFIGAYHERSTAEMAAGRQPGVSSVEPFYLNSASPQEPKG